MIGAGVGIGACGVVAYMNTRNHRERLARVESLAAASGQVQQQRYVGEDGVRREIVASPGVIASSASSEHLSDDGSRFIGPCRTVTTQIDVSGQGASGRTDYTQTFCRTAAGNMRPLPS